MTDFSSLYFNNTTIPEDHPVGVIANLSDKNMLSYSNIDNNNNNNMSQFDFFDYESEYNKRNICMAQIKLLESGGSGHWDSLMSKNMSILDDYDCFIDHIYMEDPSQMLSPQKYVPFFWLIVWVHLVAAVIGVFGNTIMITNLLRGKGLSSATRYR